MRSKLLRWICWWAFLSILLISPIDAPANAPDWPRSTDPPSVVKEKFANRIGYWLKMIRDADNQADIVTARKKLISEYHYADTNRNGYEYAQATAGFVPKLLADGLNKNDPPAMRRLREVNIALAVSTMDQKTILPALDALVEFVDNPAVRYHGWRGYRNVRTSLLCQGKEVSDIMFSALAKASESETSPAVLSELFSALQLDPIRPAQVPEDMWEYARTEFFKILQKSWLTWCQATVNGDAEMSTASCFAISAVMQITSRNPANKADLTAPLQMITDMANCAAIAYDKALTDANQLEKKRGKSRMISPAELLAKQIVNVNATLLYDCERSFNVLTDVNIETIQKAVAAVNALEVRDAVSKRITLLEPYGVKRKDFRPQPSANGSVDAAKDAG